MYPRRRLNTFLPEAGPLSVAVPDLRTFAEEDSPRSRRELLQQYVSPTPLKGNRKVHHRQWFARVVRRLRPAIVNKTEPKKTIIKTKGLPLVAVDVRPWDRTVRTLNIVVIVIGCALMLRSEHDTKNL